MRGAAFLYSPGIPVPNNYPISIPPKLDEIQRAVGGYLEVVPYFLVLPSTGERCVAFCDEEGKLKQKPMNEAATAAWYASQLKQGQHPIQDLLQGPVLVLFGDEEFMRAL